MPRVSGFSIWNALRRKLKTSNRGASLVEVLIAAGVALVVFASVLSTIMGITAMAMMSRHYAQAMHVVRGQAEELKGTAFALITNTNSVVPFDAGPDNVFGTFDDLTGTLSVTVRDALDMDGDGDKMESAIDVNGDGSNDCLDFPVCADPYAKPVRVAFTWNARLWGMNKNMTVALDTLISQ